MNNPAAAFMTILEIELKDLEEDIHLLMAECEVKKNHEEITEYVYMENLALMKKELFDVDGVLHRLKHMEPARFGSPEEVRDTLLDYLRDRVKRQIIPPVLLSMVERKFAKVLGYLDQK